MPYPADYGRHCTGGGAWLSAPCYTAREPAAENVLLGQGLPHLPRPDGRVVLDEAYLLAPIQPIEGNASGLAAVRYVERNPVRAGLVTEAEKWPWSSASAHGMRRDDLLVKVAPMLERIGDWVGYLAALEDEAVLEALRRHERTGRVLGAEPFIETLEATLARPLRPGKPGPRPRKNRD